MNTESQEKSYPGSWDSANPCTTPAFSNTLLDGPARALPASEPIRSPALSSAFLLAWRNLAHDRPRFIVTMVGIVFAVVLVAVQVGLFLGFTATITAVIKHTRADLWVAVKGVRNFEITMPQRERQRYLVQAVAGVARAEAMLVFFSAWRKPQGGDESVLVVGFDPNSGIAGPWAMIEGDPADLRLPDTVVVDVLDKAKLGIERIGQQAEINQRRARVVGFTYGIRSLTTSPYVFATFRNATHYGSLTAEQTNYVIATLAPRADLAAVKAAVQRRLPDADVFSREEFAHLTKNYWMFSTGAGTALLRAGALGLMVGMVIVAQVLYATTVDHLTEFGTLRAMGAPSHFIFRVILWQASISAVMGHLIGIIIALLVARSSIHSTALITIPPQIAVGLFLVTFLMCATASLVSIRKAMTIDPAIVFQR